jgi:biopolymer transport protein ExbB
MTTRALPTSRLLFAFLGLAAALAFPVNARAWWNPDWPMRKKITIDTTSAGVAVPDPIGGVAVLVRLHDGNFPFTAVKADGADLRLVAEDDKTPLAFHLEKFDTLLNEAFIWVRLPEVKPGAQTTFWLYYGNTGKAAERIDNVKGTYDPDTLLVYHFAERGTAAADASPLGLNAQNPGTPAEGAMIGGGLRLDGKGAVTIPAAPTFAWINGATLTWSAWVKVTAAQPNAAIFRRTEGNSSFVIGVDGGVPFAEVVNAGARLRSPAGAAFAPNTWHHLTLVADGAAMVLYVDGANYASFNARVPALSGPTLLGGEGVGGAAGFTGEIDELEISKVARPVGFIKFIASEQGGERAAAMIKFADEEQPKSWFAFLKTGYVGVIIGSLSVDGWVVIGILGVMFIISWGVMIGKAMYLNGVGKGNELFLEEWRHVATNLSVIDDQDSAKAKAVGGRVDGAKLKLMHAAPLYRVYHIGVEEIRHRLAADRSTRVLSARSIQAIRASLDGGLVRETHRLSSQMVLLTIAISGGPFLGLLGTVVGVMITFAAVAAAGDVNVNAIAPGIAAALAATVAGLGVAIPALFGYNYLLTRIKGATSDLHVFIDEFVTKMAEFYSETSEANRTITRAPFAPSEPATLKK